MGRIRDRVRVRGGELRSRRRLIGAHAVHGREHGPVLRIAAFAALAALAVAAAGASPAAASRIVDGCGLDLCAVRPDGSHRDRLTRDGVPPDDRRRGRSREHHGRAARLS